MLGKALRGGLTGFTAGIALEYLVAIAVSWALNLGYFMPCLASLPERVGGEINAVLLQTMLCGLAGAAIGVGAALFTRGKGKAPRR